MPSIATPLSLRGQLVFNNSYYTPYNLFLTGEQGAFYDPSDLSTLFQDTAGTVPVTSAGQSVARINDKSGRGNHATQATLASRPTYQIDSNGLPYLSFDGVDDGLATSTITPGADKVQIFVGLRKLSDAVTATLVELSATVAANNGAFRLSANATATYSVISKGTAGASTASSAYPSPITNVVTGIGDISGDTVTVRINGVQGGQSTFDQGTGNYLAYPLYIGSRAGTIGFFNGRLYSLVVRFGTNLDNSSIRQTERWVGSKTGVTVL